MTRTAMQTAVITIALVGAASLPMIAARAAEAETGLSNRQVAGAILIDAAKGLEWVRPARVVIARGDARAKRDDQEVRAEVLTAHYRERPDGSIEVWRIDANGNVRFTSPSESAFGEKATYDVDKQVITVSGSEQFGVTTSTSRITAEKELEYSTRTRTLIARGDAVAVDGDKTLHGEVITAHLREQGDHGQSRLQRLEAEGNVRVITPEEDIRADRGTYNVDSGVATFDGSVKVVKGSNELNGCRGEINLTTGVSRLIACPGQSDGRVRGIILPDSLRNQ
jgi:lipopolysaccharide export system protein LptA